MSFSATSFPRSLTLVIASALICLVLGLPPSVNADRSACLAVDVMDSGNPVSVTLTSTGEGAGGVVFADIDGDGDEDMLWGQGTDIHYILNDGSGGFAGSSVAYTEASSLRGFSVGDLDGDGDMDLVYLEDGQISIGENDGSATFTASVAATITSPTHISLAHLNGDDAVDLLVSAGTDVVWFENSGSLSFAAGVTINSGLTAAGPAKGVDLDGDDDNDVVVTDTDTGSPLFAWHENNGAGSFGTKNDLSTALNPSDYATGDLNSDGLIDLALMDLDTQVVYWFENQGSGSFSAAVEAISAPSPSCDSGPPAFLTGVSPDLSTTYTQFAGGSELHRDSTACDVDGDGDNDVLVALMQQNKLVLYENTGGAIASTYTDINTALTSIRFVRCLDLDNDGDMDVTVNAFTTNGFVAYQLNDGAGNFGAHQVIDTITSVHKMVHGDLDNDGDQDAAIIDHGANSAAYYINELSGGVVSWSTRHAIAGTISGPFNIRLFDLDNDGDLDIVTASETDNRIAWWRNDLAGGIVVFSTQISVTTACSGARHVWALDMDGDGDRDLVAGCFLSDTFQWLENNPTGTFNTAGVTIGSGFDGPDSVFAYDIDYDGDEDLFLNCQYNGVVAVFESVNGNVVGSSQVTLATGNPNRMHGGAADLTGDNAPELIMNNGYFANQATGIPDTSGGGSSAASFIKGGVDCIDADLDGDLDLVRAVGCGAAWVENEDGAGTFTPGTQLPLIDSAVSEVVGMAAVDVDDDGDMDVCLFDQGAEGGSSSMEILKSKGDALGCDTPIVQAAFGTKSDSSFISCYSKKGGAGRGRSPGVFSSKCLRFEELYSKHTADAVADIATPLTVPTEGSWSSALSDGSTVSQTDDYVTIKDSSNVEKSYSKPC